MAARRKPITWGEAFAAELARRKLGYEDAAAALEASVGSVYAWAKGFCVPRDVWRVRMIARWSKGRVSAKLIDRLAA